MPFTEDVLFTHDPVLAKQMSQAEVRRREKSVWVEQTEAAPWKWGLSTVLKDGYDLHAWNRGRRTGQAGRGRQANSREEGQALYKGGGNCETCASIPKGMC